MGILYTEFSYPIGHYFSATKKNELIFDIVVPLIIASISAFIIFKSQCTITSSNASDFFKTVITLLSILVGFTISSITILTATRERLSVQGIKRLKNTQINLYQLMNINFIFVLFSEIATLTFNLIFVLLLSYTSNLLDSYLNWVIVVDIFLLSHIFLLNIRNVTNFYFVLFDLCRSTPQD